MNPVSGNYIYTAATGFSGQGGFVYAATDTNNCVGTGAVIVDIDSLAANSTAFDTCNNSLTGSLIPLVMGGTGGLFFEGPIGDVSCDDATVTISGTGLYHFATTTGQTGPCTFVYEVTDGFDCSATGAVTITPNTSPIAHDGTFETCRGVAITGSLADLITGTLPPPLIYTIVTEPTNGTLVVDPSTGAFTYTPDAGFVGDDSFTFFLTDSSIPPCSTNIATVTIIVAPPPVSLDATFNTCRNTAVSGSLNALTSGGTPPYAFVVVGTPVNGMVVIDPNGTFTFNPTPGFVGVGSFQYQVTDSSGCMSVGTVTVTIGTCCPALNPFFTLVEQLYWNI
jgi:hypothetical protein